MAAIKKILPDQIPPHMITARMLAHNIINGIMPAMAGNANKVLGVNASASGVELKTIYGSTGITITHSAGLVTITATGVTAPGAHGDTHIHSGADPIPLSSANIFIGNGSNVAQARAISGDVTVDNTGVTTIGALKVTNAMLAGSIAASKLAGSITDALILSAANWNIAYNLILGALDGNTQSIDFNVCAISVSFP